MTQTMFIIGGTGFIGKEVLSEAVECGFAVKALARSDASRSEVERQGAVAVAGDAEDPGAWRDEIRATDVLVDLLQPKLPKRLSHRAVAGIADSRQRFTSGLLEQLARLEADERPLLVHVSGADDLQPAADDGIHAGSPLRSEPYSFSAIGTAVRRQIEGAPIDAAYIYLGALVYGPGKVFADLIVDGLRKGRARVVGDGSNRLPLVHVTDAARAIVHLASQPRDAIAGRAYLATDGSDTTQRELLDLTAELLGRKPPGSVPKALASLVAGRAGAEAITLHARDDNSALTGTGFEFRFPSHREGVPDVLRRLATR